MVDNTTSLHDEMNYVIGIFDDFKKDLIRFVMKLCWEYYLVMVFENMQICSADPIYVSLVLLMEYNKALWTLEY